MTRRRALILVAAMALALPGCAAAGTSDAPVRTVRPPAPSASVPGNATPEPGTTISPAPPAPSGASGPTCIDGVVEVRGSDVSVEVSVDCAALIIEGADLDVDADDAQIQDVIVRGDRNSVDLGTVVSLEVTGQANDVEADAIETLAVAGDRNQVDSDGAIGTGTVAGNDNGVEGSPVGAVDQTGDRNRIESD